jgi:hypothetical protein
MLTVVPPAPCDSPGVIVIVSEPEVEKSMTEKAVMVTTSGLEIFAGAVYTPPMIFIVPQPKPEQPTPETVQ